ncbi:MAG: alpha-amylase family glycosyl hydrolase [Acidiferrobacteraceae bacterium]
MKRRHRLPFGAEITDDRVRFRLWAPDITEVALCLGDNGQERHVGMSSTGDGWHEAVTAAAPGTRYFYELNHGRRVPDPASRFQPDDAHGASMVVDPCAYEWQDRSWTGRPWHETVIYELHVGTFAGGERPGRFQDVQKRLDDLSDLGITAIELMPVADFPGRWNWGYDGVLPFAPDHTYGTPVDLKALVDAAHARRLMVFLDVVYNHFGPESCFMPLYASSFTRGAATQWGRGFNFDPVDAAPVREFFIENALYWLEEFRMDGLRIDAPQAMRDVSRPHILEELAQRVREGPGRERHIHLMLEHPVPEVAAPLVNGYVASWDDDVHHALHVALTGERHGYYAPFGDHPVPRLLAALSEKHPWSAVVYLQNHDQVGNRAQGERISALAKPSARRAATALLLMSPFVPLLFMGEERDDARPFPFFCDFPPETSHAVARGRRREFAGLPGFDGDMLEPGDPQTFYLALTGPDDTGVDDTSSTEFYRELLYRRRRLAPEVAGARRADVAHLHGARAFSVGFPCPSGRLWLHANLSDDPARVTSPILGQWVYPDRDTDGDLQTLPEWSVICTLEAVHG